MDSGTIVAIVCCSCVGLAFVICLIKECCTHEREPEFTLQTISEANQVEGHPYQQAPAPINPAQNRAQNKNDDEGDCCAVCIVCTVLSECEC